MIKYIIDCFINLVHKSIFVSRNKCVLWFFFCRFWFRLNLWLWFHLRSCCISKKCLCSVCLFHGLLYLLLWLSCFLFQWLSSRLRIDSLLSWCSSRISKPWNCRFGLLWFFFNIDSSCEPWGCRLNRLHLRSRGILRGRNCWSLNFWFCIKWFFLFLSFLFDLFLFRSNFHRFRISPNSASLLGVLHFQHSFFSVYFFLGFFFFIVFFFLFHHFFSSY